MGGRHPKNTIDVGDEFVDGDPGGGPIDPDTGLREWYNPEPEEGSGITWADIFHRWALVEVDLHQTYGVDWGDRALRRARTGHWLRVRIIGLLSEPRTRLFRALRDREAGQAPARGDEPGFDDYA